MADTPMTTADLDAIEARVNAVVPGRWGALRGTCADVRALVAEVRRQRAWLEVAPHRPECARQPSAMSPADACTCGLHALLAEREPAP